MNLPTQKPNLVGQIVRFIVKDANGVSVSHERLIQRISKDKSKQYYEWCCLETGETGVADKDMYDKLFLVIKTKVKPLNYKGENQNVRVKMTERVTASRTNTKRYG